MELGFETIGNATLICFDKSPVLVTDPWFIGGAYFGSWGLSHEVPEEQIEAIKKCKYVWLSHGHPDHLSGESLNLLRDKIILLPNHVGGRIADGLKHEGYNISILKDRVWTELSPRMRVLCIADYNQDAILLLDLDGTLLLDLNDASDRGWRSFVRKTIRNYKDSFLLKLFSYGDADMINYFDENGVRIEPPAAKRSPIGSNITNVAKTLGVKFVVPFSSMHRYQRTDSAWANQYSTPLEDYKLGFTAPRCELLPAFIRYNCLTRQYIEINPQKQAHVLIEPQVFGDDWSDQLDKEDFRIVSVYFRSLEHVAKTFDFINFRVGGRDNRIDFKTRHFQRGITFETPRHSLMQAIKCEIFDDLLIGNYMKTTMEGTWSNTGLYPDFTPYVAKYGDNGRAKTSQELNLYFRQYRNRASLDYLRHRIHYQLHRNMAKLLLRNSKADTTLYQFVRKTWWLAQRWT